MKVFFRGVIFFGILTLFFLFSGISFADITDPTFTIDPGIVTPGNTDLIGGDADETAQNILAIILEKLIIVFGVLAAFIMTIGAGYMIIYHGQDDLLSRGKSIFTAGIIALVIALSAGIIVRLFAYLLYGG